MWKMQGWAEGARRTRARHALKRQFEYQIARAGEQEMSHSTVEAAMRLHSQEVRSTLEGFRPLKDDDRVLEVGSGSEGLIFFFGAKNAVGIDPLAEHYRCLLPWHSRVETVACGGELLPFPDQCFDVILCDNVVDHAESPSQIIKEVARVLAPGGIFYFTVNVHSRFWYIAAQIHALWRSIGIPLEITPFADHTVHMTRAQARKLVRSYVWDIVSEKDNIPETKALRHVAPQRHLGDHLKRFFFKNANYEMIALRPQCDQDQTA